MVVSAMRLTLVLAVAICAYAQSEDAGKSTSKPKNIKVMLRADDVAEVVVAMRIFNTSLGVDCLHCHVQGDFASDENPKKETARTMLLLVREINAKLGERKVSCYTCHRGSSKPATAPSETK